MPLLRVIALSLALGAAASGQQATGEYRRPDFGFRVGLPEGWVAVEQSASGDSLVVALSPLNAADRVQLLVRVNPPGVDRDPEAALQRALRDFADNPDLSKLKPSSRDVAGREAPALRVDSNNPDQTWAVRQAFVAEHGFLFILQDATFAKDFRDRVDDFDDVWDMLEFIPLSAERVAQLRLERLAARCGSEIDWAADWDAAERRSRNEGRPILVTARMYPGFAISDDRMSGSFMSPDIIALVQERFVALDIGPGAELPLVDEDVYGMSNLTFGSATLVVSPDGDVLLDVPSAMDELLIDALVKAAAIGLPGPPPPQAEPRLDAARAHYRRGELDRVEALLSEPEHAAEYQLLAQRQRRLRNGPAALEALALARAASGSAALAVELDLDESLVLARMGRLDEALDRLQSAMAARPDHPEALYRRGNLARLLEGRDAAEVWYQRVIDEHAETRWAWAAAATLTSTAWSLDEGGRLDWPDEELYALKRPAQFAPVDTSEAQQAEQDALEFLLSRQRDDGTWPLPTDFRSQPGDPPDDFQLAITAICIQALLPHRDDPRVAAAVERAVDWVLPAYEAAAAGPGRSYFMDYTVWSRPYVLWLLADLVDRDVRSAKQLKPIAQRLFDELSAHQKPGGGWSYYVTGDIEAATPTVLMSMSFTTATNVLALLAARDAGLKPPAELIKRGLDSLENARTEDGFFTYMVGRDAPQADRPLGAAGRGPLCALALYRGKRTGRDEVRSRLNAFVEHRDRYVSETGKALMHTGLQGEGSHWLMYDYANAAAAVAALPRSQRRRFVTPILESVLAARTDDGAYVDNPIIGSVHGAGMALAVYDHLLPAGR